jgi:hypothetical protein
MGDRRTLPLLPSRSSYAGLAPGGRQIWYLTSTTLVVLWLGLVRESDSVADTKLFLVFDAFSSSLLLSLSSS